MGCTVSLVCCEALEPGPRCGPQPPGSPPAPAPWEYREPPGSVRAQSRRLLLQPRLRSSLRASSEVAVPAPQPARETGGRRLSGRGEERGSSWRKSPRVEAPCSPRASHRGFRADAATSGPRRGGPIELLPLEGPGHPGCSCGAKRPGDPGAGLSPCSSPPPQSSRSSSPRTLTLAPRVGGHPPRGST
ncbi:hypothetical protein AB1E18_001196 [Capra hircus]